MAPIPKLLKYLGRSPWIYHINTGSCNGCDIEIVAVLTPRYDAERFGVVLVESPRHADILLVTGPVCHQNLDRVKRVYEQTPDPKMVIAVGACSSTNGVFDGSYCIDGPLDDVIPVDVYVIGCPPRPENILFGVVKAIQKLNALAEGEI